VLNIGDGKREGASIKRLLDLTASDMGRVNELILARAGSEVQMIPEVANHLISSGGKRLRPMVTLAAAQMFGYSGDGHVKLATSVEFMHTATLLHDDVVDESDLRRGKKTARMIWGNQASVLVGDYLLGQAFLMMVETGKLDALGVLAKAATVIAEGEVFQLSKAGDLAATPDDYNQVIHAKTATLFQAAAEVGAMAGGADEAGRAALRDYGLELGLAFQLVDDVLDYRGESGAMGKNTGDDLREGKMTLPVILTLADANPAEREIITASLGKADASDTALSQIVTIMNRHNALGRTVDEAHDHVRRARAALDPLPASEMKTILSDIAEFYVSRAY
jgi:octaprenyl-diphosphate synthase